MSFWTDLLGLEFEVKYVDVKGIKTRAMKAGCGEPVIFLHGISGHLEAFISSVPGHSGDFECHLIDMLGCGYTDKPQGKYTVERLARHVLDYMDVMGLEKANLCGISLGGWVVGWIAAKYPERVKRVTMVLAAGTPAMATSEIAEMIRQSTTAAVTNLDIEDTRKRLLKVIYDPKQVTQELVEVRYTIYHHPEFQAALDNILAPTEPELYRQAMLSEKLLADVQAEVLLVWSDKDAYTDLTGAQHFVNNIPKHKLVTFENTGHWPPYERSADFACLNVGFLKGGLTTVRAGNYDANPEGRK
ncbi:alpha/beta hydrolase [Pseudomonas hefeiensis]|uniref:Alpha/beta hydrolase n=1 Tax=Pseudomonas hefeiensis TaxID=2738125 RepID=A0ABY9GGM1_9PSED|nr:MULTISPECIES: alpha/beta hydrolase [unclassified Pseudomonas]WLH14809.1 alpha/beta hydrolase [Pseudomonas sp. FP205]WLH97860.1 alpha/beta hydrolase [Pseudomonas sp. FP53]WLI42135.1 alpha/beta hydrolase [Pseudomonas sp. FP821]